MNSLQLTVLWKDYDGMLSLAVRATSAAHSAYHETYVYPSSLSKFAEGLKGFPSPSGEELALECGSKDPKWHDYFRMRVLLVKPTGQSALEFESEVREDPPFRAECHFFVAGLPADFNRMGAELAAWLAEPAKPLRVEWQNG